MCGIFGIYEHPRAKELTYYATLALQHRGQNGCGASVKNPRNIIETHKDFGRVDKVFFAPEFHKLSGNTFITHLRWPTQGEPSSWNLQPLYTSTLKGKISIVSNGDIVNMKEQSQFLDQQEIIRYSNVDAEVIAATINYQVSHKGRNIVEAIKKAITYIQGSYSAAIITEFDNRLFLFRDPYGIRPFFLGKLDGCHAFASETCALEKIKAQIIGEVAPGEIVAIGPDGLERYVGVEPQERHFCVFELIWFMRPDSYFYVDGKPYRSCQYLRKMMGQELAREFQQSADIVMGIPKSGNPSASGYAQKIGIPLDTGIITDPHAGRTFLEMVRKDLVSSKFNALRDIVSGKSILITDDSLIEGENCRRVIEVLRQAGAREIHLAISSPPYKYPCFYGVDTGCSHKKLLAAKMSIEEIRQYVNADSLHYLSFDGLYRAIGQNRKNFCDACFSGNYPIPLPEELKEGFCNRHKVPLTYFDRTET